METQIQNEPTEEEASSPNTTSILNQQQSYDLNNLPSPATLDILHRG
jgi:hypothetical protein